MKNTREKVHNFQSMIHDYQNEAYIFLKKSRRKGDWSRFLKNSHLKVQDYRKEVQILKIYV
jgi:hypothetical protein